ncbi:LemA family protein [Dehalococcoides sp. THU3]|uniref:LemA family protein n=1 Tax=Dehalococcoides TaxID=61434 RepID=UPI0005B567DE|nr:MULTISPECIES: LemA family protein [Dehalococcoides]QYY58567.1 LemA family protein [Dehalococcoides mccartyi]BAQ34052.1 LemA family protein [Dehalococcoides sp. UCH007]
MELQIWGYPVFALGLTALVLAFRTMRRKRLVDDIPTSRTRGVFIGLVELKGTAESEKPFTGFLSAEKCVYYHYKVEERWSRMVTESYTDAKGHVQFRTRQESGWTQVASGKEMQPFYLKDETGIILIQPEGADIQPKNLFNKTCGRNDPLYYAKGPQGSVANSDHQRRFTEEALPLHAELYIMGQSRERQDVVAPEIAKDKSAPLYVISTRTEKQISRRYSGWFWFWIILGLLISLGSGLLLSQRDTESFNPDWGIVALWSGFFLLSWLLGWLWAGYNSLVGLRNRVCQGYAQVDIQLKRRFDLIPNLAKSVEGFSRHERELQEMLAEVRTVSKVNGQDTMDIKGASAILVFNMEKYPELKADTVFLKLQEELAATESRIALARDYYNSIATFYNTRREIFPDHLLAGIFGFKERVLINASDLERAALKVKLAE